MKNRPREEAADTTSGWNAQPYLLSRRLRVRTATTLCAAVLPASFDESTRIDMRRSLPRRVDGIGPRQLGFEAADLFVQTLARPICPTSAFSRSLTPTPRSTSTDRKSTRLNSSHLGIS